MEKVLTTSQPIRGVWPALLTPLTKPLSIDTKRLAAHARSLLDAGCAGVTLFGTTGEGPSFSLAERKAALAGLVEAGVPADRILVHVGCAALPDAVELAKDAVGRGSPCMMLPPFFLKGVPDAGVIESFAWLIDGVADPRLKLYLYHIPAVSGVDISAATIRALRKRYPQTIMGIKDSSCDLPHALDMARQFSGEMAVFVGFEPHLPAVRKAGGSGTVCGIANMMPRLINRLVDKPEGPSVEADLAKVQRLLDVISPYSLMPAFKGMMAELTGEAGWLRVRPPLAPLGETERRELVRDMAGIGIDRSVD